MVIARVHARQRLPVASSFGVVVILAIAAQSAGFALPVTRRSVLHHAARGRRATSGRKSALELADDRRSDRRGDRGRLGLIRPGGIR